MTFALNRTIFGDCRDSMRAMIAAGVKVNCVVTSPPYWGLRDYGVPPSVWGGDPACEHQWGSAVTADRTSYKSNSKARWNHRHNGRGEEQAHMVNRSGWERKDVKQGQFCECGAWLGALGLEPDYRMFIANMVEVFSLARDVMADDATCWMNLGDSYATGAGAVGQRPGGGAQGDGWAGRGDRNGAAGKHGYVPGIGPMTQPNRMPQAGLKPKDLCMMPHRVAIALQEDGWWVRQDIVWAKPNPMPESVTDRCTKSHEYIFLLAKRERYYFDADAIAEPVSQSMLQQIEQGYEGQATKDYAGTGAQDPSATKSNILKKYGGVTSWDTSVGEGRHGSVHKDGRAPKTSGNKARKDRPGAPEGTGKHQQGSVPWEGFTRNKRSVWTVTTKPYPEAHFATFPPDLITPCILAGCPSGGVVFDPFMGSGTTAEVAQSLGRSWLGCELNQEYAALQEKRTRQMGMAI